MDVLQEFFLLVSHLTICICIVKARKFTEFGSPGGCFTQAPKKVIDGYRSQTECSMACYLLSSSCTAFIYTKDKQCRLYDKVQKLNNDDQCMSFYESGAQLNIVGSPAKMDSFDPNWNALGSRAVDGDLTRVFSGSSCVHSDIYYVPHWLMVDVLDTYVIDKVVIVHRKEPDSDLYVNRFTKMSLLVSEDTSVWTTFNKDNFVLCRYLEGPPSLEAPNVEFQCSEPKPKGRFICLYKDVTWVPGYQMNTIDACEMLVYIKSTNI